MKRNFLLLDPDPPAGGGGEPEPKPAGKKPSDPATSADTGAGGKTAREIALEKKVATLEDEQNSLKGQLKGALDWIKGQTEAKPADKRENLLDEVNSVLGWGTD